MAMETSAQQEALRVSGNILKGNVYETLKDKTALVLDQNLRPEVAGYSFLIQQNAPAPEQNAGFAHALLSTAMEMLRRNPPFALTPEQSALTRRLFARRKRNLDLNEMMAVWKKLTPRQQDTLLNLSIRKLQSARKLTPGLSPSPSFRGRPRGDFNGLRVLFSGTPQDQRVRVWGDVASRLSLSMHQNRKRLLDLLNDSAPSPN